MTISLHRHYWAGFWCFLGRSFDQPTEYMGLVLEAEQPRVHPLLFLDCDSTRSKTARYPERVMTIMTNV